MATRQSPDSSYAGEGDGGKLSAPAARRNRDEITEVLRSLAPATGHALELASGTGEHIVRFGPAMPGLTWQPSDPAPERRASIRAWLAEVPAPNTAAPIDLDACAPGWAARHGPVDLVFVANLLHLVTEPEATTCLAEMAKVLAPGGLAAIYGPFLRDGRATSEGDAAFDARLREALPGAGYKDLGWVQDRLRDTGLGVLEPVPMAANNLIVLARAPY